MFVLSKSNLFLYNEKHNVSSRRDDFLEFTQIRRKRQLSRRSGISQMASINQFSHDSSFNDTMRVEKTVLQHDRVCHYCITYKAPSWPRMPHTNEIAISRGYYKTYGKSDLSGTSRMQGYDRESGLRLLIKH